MIKKYSIISLNGFLYAVDKEAVIAEGDYILFDGEVPSQFEDGNPDFVQEDPKIIASNDPSLKGLPCLPEIEDIIDMTLEKEFGCKKNLFPSKEWNWFKRAYKAASEEKKYSEEDMRRAWDTAFGIGYKHASISTEKFSFNAFMNSLYKTPIAFECEMQHYGWISEKTGVWKYETHEFDFVPKDKFLVNYIPTVDKNNHLIGRYIYER